MDNVGEEDAAITIIGLGPVDIVRSDGAGEVKMIKWGDGPGNRIERRAPAGDWFGAGRRQVETQWGRS